MSEYTWIKLHHNILNDYSMAHLPPRLWIFAVECFLMAGELDRGGLLPSVLEMSERLDRTMESIEDDLECLHDQNIILYDCEKGFAWVGPSWVRRFHYGGQATGYHEYLKTPRWQYISTGAKITADWQCECCSWPTPEVVLHTHHLSYDNVGNEPPEDLEVLCRFCHENEHGIIHVSSVVPGGFQQSLTHREWEY